MLYNGSILMLLSPLTPLHAGTGRSGGVVDLPIQRDSVGFPIVYASTLKGALKTHVYLRDAELAKKLFGPEPEPTEEKYAAPVSLTDAYVLMIPVRSARGNPALLTSPFLVRRGLDLLDLASATESKNEEALSKVRGILEELSNNEVEDGEAVTFSESVIPSVGGERRVIICGEQLKVKEIKEAKLKDAYKQVSNALPKAFSDAFPERLILVGDDTALRLIEKSLIRLTRVRLDREKKTVIQGGLWTEEYLPHGTLLISLMLYSVNRALRAKLVGNTNEDLRSKIVREGLGIRNNCGYVVFGGKESVGKGITKVYLL